VAVLEEFLVPQIVIGGPGVLALIAKSLIRAFIVMPHVVPNAPPAFFPDEQLRFSLFLTGLVAGSAFYFATGARTQMAPRGDEEAARRIVRKRAGAAITAFVASMVILTTGFLGCRSAALSAEGRAYDEMYDEIVPSTRPKTVSAMWTAETRGRAEYYAALGKKYHKAATKPWLPVAPDPPEPE
jgi:hypothetical protein